ncbi:hypothetical protein [Haloarchaeobius litoreus]|uniref:Uncharacterized protein n=1 Tax=Haloarchaeobius litoreus TaxID=755306 RepID=A0ABD6DJJ7_9EURY|nr:hypothetical protein [Haloarchaeobius litoreus]
MTSRLSPALVVFAAMLVVLAAVAGGSVTVGLFADRENLDLAVGGSGAPTPDNGTVEVTGSNHPAWEDSVRVLHEGDDVAVVSIVTDTGGVVEFTVSRVVDSPATVMVRLDALAAVGMDITAFQLLVDGQQSPYTVVEADGYSWASFHMASFSTHSVGFESLAPAVDVADARNESVADGNSTVDDGNSTAGESGDGNVTVDDGNSTVGESGDGNVTVDDGNSTVENGNSTVGESGDGNVSVDDGADNVTIDGGDNGTVIDGDAPVSDSDDNSTTEEPAQPPDSGSGDNVSVGDSGEEGTVGDDSGGVDDGTDSETTDDDSDAGTDTGTTDDGSDAGTDTGTTDDGSDAGTDTGTTDDTVDSGTTDDGSGQASA